MTPEEKRKLEQKYMIEKMQERRTLAQKYLGTFRPQK